MGLFDIIGTALSIATTIGKVAGTLSDALNSARGDSLVHFGYAGDGNSHPDLGQAVFWRDRQTGRIQVLNQSTDSSLELFFPGNPFAPSTGQTIVIAPGGKADIGDMFEFYSKADVDSMIITPSTDQGPSAVGVKGGSGGYAIQVSGQNIAPKATVKLGSSVQIEASDTTVRIAVVGGLALVGIVLLNVRGAGATAARLINVTRKPSVAEDDNTSMTVSIPQGVDISAGIASIDLTLAVEPTSKAPNPFLTPHPNVVPLSDEDHARLAAFVAHR